MQFFDRLIPLLTKNFKEGMDKIKDLLGFFSRKLSIIQSRMKVLTDGFYSLILSILNLDNQIND